VGVLTALLLSLSLGHAKPPVVRVSAEPSEVVSLYQEAALQAGLEGAALLPACKKWSATFFMCFMLEENETQRMVHLGDLSAWETTLEELESVAREAGSIVLSEGRAREVRVEGIAPSYRVFNEGDGWDASILFFPEQLQALLGGEPVLAVPSRGLVIAWIPGDPELDQVVAVGVRRIYEQAEQPISPVVVHWTGSWTRWGEARPGP
jgi:hypothetical protein